MNMNHLRSLSNPITLRMIARLRRGAVTSRALARDVAAPSGFAFNSIVKKLTRDGILHRVASNGRVEYSLTEFGTSYVEPAGAMLAWLDERAGEIQRHRDSFFHDVEEGTAE
jgi:DNA-binding HxlR family transcriptional regulator